MRQLFYIDVEGHYDCEFDESECLTFSVVNPETNEANWATMTPEVTKELYEAMKKYYK